MRYMFDNYYNKIIYCKYKPGETYTFDGIETLCVYNEDYEDEFVLFVDKNHDLDYYFNGYDSVDSADYSDSSTTFGYEWGGYYITTGIADQSIGAGLTNTNSLIEMNLESYYEWPLLWDKVVEFREQVNNERWFVPSGSEISYISNYKTSLENLSTSYCPYYWSSSENEDPDYFSTIYACMQVVYSPDDPYIDFLSGTLCLKRTHNCRCRLFRQL